jgi:hypothetical protein
MQTKNEQFCTVPTIHYGFQKSNLIYYMVSSPLSPSLFPSWTSPIAPKSMKSGKPPSWNPPPAPLRHRPYRLSRYPPLDLDPMDQIQSNQSHQKPYWSNPRQLCKQTLYFYEINPQSMLVQKYLQNSPFFFYFSPYLFIKLNPPSKTHRFCNLNPNF